MDVAPDHPIKFLLDGSWQGQISGALQTYALRCLADLRGTDLPAGVAGAVRQVQVAQPGYFPGKITFYFRVPPGGVPPGSAGCRVLLLVPSYNDGAAQFCLDNSNWARFADAHGLCLVVPQFLNLWCDSRLPEQWAGGATLEALRQIGQEFPIQQNALLLHGYGHGTEFVERFSQWKPELCAAVSANSTSDWGWQEALPLDLHPASDLRHVSFLVTCGDEEYGGLWSVYPASVRFITFARAAGVPILWKLFPHTPHRPTPEMERLAQAFLADQLAPHQDMNGFVGDIRTWEFFQNSDPRAAAIPDRWRQQLSSHALALLWGKEMSP